MLTMLGDSWMASRREVKDSRVIRTCRTLVITLNQTEFRGNVPMITKDLMDLKIIRAVADSETRDSYSERHLEMTLPQHPIKLASASPHHLWIHTLMPMKIEVDQAKLEGPQDPVLAENWQAGKILKKTHTAAFKSSQVTASKRTCIAIAIASSNIILIHPKIVINTRTKGPTDDLWLGKQHQSHMITEFIKPNNGGWWTKTNHFAFEFISAKSNES